MKKPTTKKLEAGFDVSQETTCTFEGNIHAEAGQRASAECSVVLMSKK